MPGSTDSPRAGNGLNAIHPTGPDLWGFLRKGGRVLLCTAACAENRRQFVARIIEGEGHERWSGAGRLFVAEAMHKKADAFARYGDAAELQMVVEVLPSVVAKASEPLSAVGQGDGDLDGRREPAVAYGRRRRRAGWRPPYSGSRDSGPRAGLRVWGAALFCRAPARHCVDTRGRRRVDLRRSTCGAARVASGVSKRARVAPTARPTATSCG